ncbi:LuxR C-terminal-related transcriptional regulator [Pseudomonas sp. NPDC098747]|uniref:LuxR C-terminal-related transcriptional regulator n=1 Tax=Pseudomonas sp. NPDC098747 TaxID=3364487 RepID=UPI00383ADDE8
MSSLIRVGVLDEQEVVRYGLHWHLADQPGISVAGTYSRASDALSAAEHGNIDLLLMGYVLQDSNGQHLIKTMVAHHPEIRILVFLAEPCVATATLLLSIGGHGIVCKREPLEVCVYAIRLLATGQHYQCASIAMAEDPVVPDAPIDIGEAEVALLSHPGLSRREREVLSLCISGLTVTRIAEISERSLKTVSTQKLAAYRKLGVKNDMDLFRRLSRLGA